MASSLMNFKKIPDTTYEYNFIVIVIILSNLQNNILKPFVVKMRQTPMVYIYFT